MSKLPNYDRAIVSESKVTNYLLSEMHPKGKDKAAFFSKFGFSVTDWEVLKEALLKHAASYEIARIVSTQHCLNYVIEGELETPDGRKPNLRSVWCMEHNTDIPHLVTAYPMDAENDNS